VKRRRVLISADAEAQLDAIRSWWLANRPAAPELFDRELDATVAEVFRIPASRPTMAR